VAVIVPSLINLSRKSLGITTLVQAALPKILDTVPKSYYEDTMSLVEVGVSRDLRLCSNFYLLFIYYYFVLQSPCLRVMK